jgi:hypothetical protein
LISWYNFRGNNTVSYGTNGPGVLSKQSCTTVTMSPPNSNAVEPTCSPGRGQARGQRWGARPLRGGTHLDHSDTMSAAPTWKTPLCLGPVQRRKRTGKWEAYAKGWIQPRRLEGHTYGVLCLVVGLGGTVYSGSYEETVRVWRWGKEIRGLEGHTMGVFAVAVPGPSPHSAVLLIYGQYSYNTSKTSASCHTHHSPGCLDLRVATVTTKDGVGGELFKFRGVRRGRSGGSTNSQVLRKCFEKW